jgi:hypothetical protein
MKRHYYVIIKNMHEIGVVNAPPKGAAADSIRKKKVTRKTKENKPTNYYYLLH